MANYLSNNNAGLLNGPDVPFGTGDSTGLLAGNANPPSNAFYRAMRQFIPPGVRDIIPSWGGLGRGYRDFFSTQGAVQGMRDLGRMATTDLFDQNIPITNRMSNATIGAGMLPLAILGTAPFFPNVGNISKVLRRSPPDGRGSGGGGIYKSMMDTPDLRVMSVDDAVKTARSEPHLIQSKGDGQYVGGPRGATSMDDILRARASFDEHVERGVQGADWYTRAREFNVETQPRVAPGSNQPSRSSLAADEQAHWSPVTDPDPNLNVAIHGRTTYEAGVVPKILRTGRQSRKYVEGREAGTFEDIHGPKTGIYAQNLDPNRPPTTTGTNDIWHARAFGYKGKDGEPDALFDRALTEQEHRFIDYETMLAVDRANARQLGGRSNWTAEQLQASAWVAAKGRGLAKRRNLTEAEGIALAAKSYPEYAAKYTASIPTEQVPGRSTELLPGLLDADDAARVEFSEESLWANPVTNQDTLLGEVFGGYIRPTLQGTGVYKSKDGEWEYNPVEVHRQMVPYEAAGGARFIPEYVEKGLDATQSVRGLLDMQEGSAWGKVITHGTGPFDAFHLNTGAAPTKAQMKSVVELGEKHGFDVVANADGGLAFAKFGDKPADTAREVLKALKGDFGAALNRIFDDAEIVRGKWQGGYIDLSKQLAIKHAGKGRATNKVLKELRTLKKVAPGLYDNLINSTGVQIKAKKNLARYNKWLAKLGGQQRDDYVKLLDIVGQGKIKGLIDYVKKYGSAGLPAIAAVGLSSSLRGVSDDTDSQSREGRT